MAAIIAAGLIPAGLEMMDRPMTQAVEDFVKAGYDLEAVAILLVESDGTPEEVEEEIARLREVLIRAGATRCDLSQDEAQRLRFWSGLPTCPHALQGPCRCAFRTHAPNRPAAPPCAQE